MNIDGDKIAKGITIAFLVVLGIATIVGTLFMVLYIITLILGVLFALASGGSLPVSNNTTVLLASLENAFSTVLNSLITSTIFAASLIPIAIILLVFAGVFLGVQAYKKWSKGGKGGSGGDMSY